MSEEAQKLVARLNQLADAVTRADWSEFSMRVPVETDRDADIVLSNAAMYIERIERERDEARTILAHTDIGSLPNDWTLKQVAEARINDLMKLRDQVRDTCARAEKAEAENARLRPLAPVLNGFVGPPPTPEQWERICAKAASVRRLLVELDARARP